MQEEQAMQPSFIDFVMTRLGRNVAYHGRGHHDKYDMLARYPGKRLRVAVHITCANVDFVENGCVTVEKRIP